MRRVSIRAFAVLAYAAFVLSFTYFAAFVCELLPTPPPSGTAAAFVDVALVLAFGVSHSVMARDAFKKRLVRVVPAEAERSLYVLVASVLLFAMCALWRPLPGGVIWSASGVLALVLRGVQIVGFVIALVSSFLIDHFALFGLRQAFGPVTPVESAAELRTPLLYRWVRHPLYSGMLLALWAAPTMTLASLVLAVTLTAYVLVGVRLEERDLLAVYGATYERYRQQVGALVPRILRR